MLQTVKMVNGTSASPLARYDQIVSLHIVPALGQTNLKALTPRDVQLMVSHLRQSVAPASVVKIHGVLRNALADAERIDLVPRNVAMSVRSETLSGILLGSRRNDYSVADRYDHPVAYQSSRYTPSVNRQHQFIGCTSGSQHFGTVFLTPCEQATPNAVPV